MWRPWRLMLLPIAPLVCLDTVRAETVVISVSTSPPGAQISVDGVDIGRSPIEVKLLEPEDGQFNVLAELPLYDPVEIEAASALRVELEVTLTPRRGRITVDSVDDAEPAYDGLITLREALLYARGEREPRGADLIGVELPVGNDHPADIVFDAEVFDRLRVIPVKAPLPPLDVAGTALVGPEPRVVIMPAAGVTVSGAALRVGADTWTERLDIDGFQLGIELVGDGEAGAADLSIAGAIAAARAASGGRLAIDGSSAAVLGASRFAAEGGLIDGGFAPIDIGPPDRVVFHVDQSGPGARVRAIGWMPAAAPPILFARADRTVPLGTVPGLRASASSYDAYRPFASTEEGFQKFPSAAVDGAESEFRWDASDQRRVLEVAAQRPLRSAGLRIRHTEEGNRLLSYNLVLLDKWRVELFRTKVTSTGPVDEISFDPKLDFVTILIEAQETEGALPGIVEIQGEVLDSLQFPAVAYSVRQAVFERPQGSPEIVVEIGSELYPLDGTPLADGLELILPPYARPAPPSGERPRSRVLVESAGDSVQSDDELTLREALLFAGGERTLSDREAARVEGSIDGPLEIALAGQTIALAEPLPTIRHPDLLITGGGASLDGPQGAPLIAAAQTRRLILRDLSLRGSLAANQVASVELRDVSLEQSGPVGVLLERSPATIIATRISGGEVGIRAAESSVRVIDTEFEDLGVGLEADSRSPLEMLGNRFRRTARPVDLAVSEYPLLHLAAGNTAELPATEPLPGVVDRPARAMFVANEPEYLGLDRFSLAPSWRVRAAPGMVDIRSQGERAAIHVVDPGEPDARCIVEGSDGVLRGGGTAVLTVLNDAPADVWCTGPGGAARLRLLPPSAPQPEENGDGGMVASAQASVGITRFHITGPADPQILVGLSIAPQTREFGPNAIVPHPLASMRNSSALALSGSLAAAGEPALALAAIVEELDRDPSSDQLIAAASYAAEQWAVALEAEERFVDAEAVLAGVAARLPDRPEPRDAYVSHRHRHARHLIDQSNWQGARDVLAAILSDDRSDELAQQNITYVFQEWAKKRIENEPAAAVLEWLLDEAESMPAVGEDVRNAGAVLVNNAFVEAVQAKRFSQALEFASLGFEMTPDAHSRENLLYGLQEAAKEAVSSAQPEQALAMFEALVRRHPELTEAGGILANVFYGEVEARSATGDTAGALAAASLLMRAPGINEAEQIYVIALARHSEVVRNNDGPAAAFAVWAEAAAAHPDSLSIRTGAAQFANELAISHLDAGSFAEAIGAFEAGLKFSPDDESLKGNLRVAYINAAVTAVNDGRLQEAARFAEEGLSAFPADGDLTEILNHARGN